MVAPPGAVEYYNGYPIIYPPTINPEADWVGIMEAQATWLDQRVQHVVANPTELNVRFSGLTATDQRLVAVQSDKTLRWWSGTEWIIIAQGGSTVTPRASYDAGFRQASDGAELLPGSGGSETYRWSRLAGGVNVAVTGLVVRGTGGSVGSGGYAWSLPVTPRDYRMVSGTGYVYDQSTGTEYPCILRGTGGTAVSLMLAGSGKRVGNAVPDSPLPAWAIGDTIMWDVVYEGVSS